LRTGKSEGCTIFFGFAISAPRNRLSIEEKYQIKLRM